MIAVFLKGYAWMCESVKDLWLLWFASGEIRSIKLWTSKAFQKGFDKVLKVIGEIGSSRKWNDSSKGVDLHCSQWGDNHFTRKWSGGVRIGPGRKARWESAYGGVAAPATSGWGLWAIARHRHSTCEWMCQIGAIATHSHVRTLYRISSLTCRTVSHPLKGPLNRYL